MKVPVFANRDQVLSSLDPSFPVFCIRPDLLRRQAEAFLRGFPGTVLYAVKCNPLELVLNTLWDAGISDFDTASLAEVARVSEGFPTAHLYFNHPVKSRAAIDAATCIYGLNDFVIDHECELAKLADYVQDGAVMQVRLATPSTDASYNLSSKFGAAEDKAVSLLRLVGMRGYRSALSFHVGSQCREPDAYRRAMALAARVRDRASADLAYLNVGGGFPAAYDEQVRPLAEYFDTISRAAQVYGFEDVPLLCEPGRALVASAGSLLVQVHLRKDDALYINEGLFGFLSEVRDGDIDPPVEGIGRQGPLCGSLMPFKVFGPTCDPCDVLKIPFHLPSDIQEGDWIEIGMLGAYSNAVSSVFNGFSTDCTVCVEA